MTGRSRLSKLVRGLAGPVTAALWIFAIAGTFLALAIVQPMLLRLAVPFLLVLILLWSLAPTWNPPAKRIPSLLKSREFEESFQLAVQYDRLGDVRDFLKLELPLPAPGLRNRMEEAFDELALLHSAVYDTENTYLDPSLRRAMQQGSDEARTSFWNIARNLAVVAHQQVGFSDEHPKIRRIAKLLEDLQFAAASARQRVAELTLGASETGLSEARDAFEEMRRRSEALLQLETLVG